MAGRKGNAKSRLENLRVWVGIIPLGIFVALYLNRPFLETNHAPVIDCRICDNQQDIKAPTDSSNEGATVSLTIENTGSSATTITEHNLSWTQVPETMLLSDGLSETPCANDGIEVHISAHSSKILRLELNEFSINVLRHPLPMGSTIGPRIQDKAYVFVHVKYTDFGIPTMTEYCFQYVPTHKGLSETWAACPKDVHIHRP